MKNKKDIKILFSSLLIFISFFMWYFFAQKKTEIEIENIKKEVYFINIEKTKTKLKITNPNKNVIVKLNWEILGKEKIILDTIIK